MSAPPGVEALARRILDGDAPLPVRSAAARGALPLPRAVLAHLFVHLLHDPEEAIRADAGSSLSRLSDHEIREVLADPDCPSEVLTHFAPRAARDETLAEPLVFHPAVPEPALTVLAAQGSAGVIDLVLTNEERLLTWPGLLDRLTVNPALKPHQRGRILDLLDRVSRVGSGESGGEPIEFPDNPAMEEAARLLQVDVGDLVAASEILDGHEFERAEDPVIRSVYRKILTLNTAQKAILAMKGGREERMILVRDTNKVVALSTLKNPRLGEQEVEGIAGMRNVSEEVLRAVGTNREWTKNYGVVSQLVRNPRTPPGISTNFVSRLVTKDLKILAGDKNVPEIIRRMARNTWMLRTQKPPARPGRK